MRQSPSESPTPEQRRSSNVAVQILLDMADTSWRIFVPTISLLLLGRYVDVRIGTTPYLMLLGAVIGGVIAGMLIRKQLKQGPTY